MPVSFAKLSANIGARVSGIDITSDLSDAALQEVRAGLVEHKALVFDAPGLTAEGQERFAGRFGAMLRSVEKGTREGHRLVLTGDRLRLVFRIQPRHYD